MTKKKTMKRDRTVSQEENFRFALNAAVLAVLIGILVMLVQQMPFAHSLGSKAVGY